MHLFFKNVKYIPYLKVPAKISIRESFKPVTQSNNQLSRTIILQKKILCCRNHYRTRIRLLLEKGLLTIRQTDICPFTQVKIENGLAMLSKPAPRGRHDSFGTHCKEFPSDFRKASANAQISIKSGQQK